MPSRSASKRVLWKLDIGAINPTAARLWPVGRRGPQDTRRLPFRNRGKPGDAIRNAGSGAGPRRTTDTARAIPVRGRALRNASQSRESMPPAVPQGERDAGFATPIARHRAPPANRCLHNIIRSHRNSRVAGRRDDRQWAWLYYSLRTSPMLVSRMVSISSISSGLTVSAGPNAIQCGSNRHNNPCSRARRPTRTPKPGLGGN